MGAHNMLSPEERWAVIHYIRDLGEALIPSDAAFHEKTRAELLSENTINEAEIAKDDADTDEEDHSEEGGH
jgi:hypothetical protein